MPLRAAALYLLTIALEIPGAAARWLLGGLLGLLLVALTGLIGLDLPSGLVTGALGIGGCLFPILWSLTAFVYPGNGWLWRQRTGGRPPSTREQEALDTSLAQLTATDPTLKAPKAWFVVDDHEINAAVRGHTLMITRGLLDLPTVTDPILAHELGHLNTTDGRLTEALCRLVLPTRTPTPTEARANSPSRQRPTVTDDFIAEPISTLIAALIGLIAGITIGLAGGGLGLRLLAPLWGAYWRGREYAADQYAHHLGQGENLAAALQDHALFTDVPIPFIWLTTTTHPPTELRIDRLITAPDAPC